MGLEPTRCNHHKILSLARLPIPTLPHNFAHLIFRVANSILSLWKEKVNGYFEFIQIILWVIYPGRLDMTWKIKENRTKGTLRTEAEKWEK